MKKQNRASRGKTKKSGKSAQVGSAGIFKRDEFLKWRKKQEQFSEEIGHSDAGLTSQVLYRSRKGNRYSLSVEWNQVCENGAWLNQARWAEMLTNEKMRLGDKRRRVCIMLPITRSDAVRWLDRNIIGNLIPSEFQNDFRRGIADAAMATPTAATYKTAFLALLKLPGDVTNDVIDDVVERMC